MKVTLLMLTLNEIDGMKAIMPKIKKEWYDQLLIADGGSTDGTIEYAEANGYEIFVQKKAGLGAAFIEAFEKVIGDIIILFSPDGNSLPEKIPVLIEKMKEGYDIVIVSRYLDEAKSYDDDMITSFGNWFFTKTVNLLFGSNITDFLVIFKAYKTELIKELGVTTHSCSWASEILLKAIKKGKKIGEIPGDEPPRIGGVRKMQPFKNGLIELTRIIKEFVVR